MVTKKTLIRLTAAAVTLAAIAAFAFIMTREKNDFQTEGFIGRSTIEIPD